MGIFNHNQVEYDEKLSVFRELVRISVYILFLVVVILCIHCFVGSKCTVSGRSMEPTLYEGESVWVSKLAYQSREPQRFDIILFPYDEEGVFYIKRIIALPGETVYIDAQGNIYIGTKEDILINEQGKVETHVEPIQEPVVCPTIQEENRGDAASPITLGLDEYFVLGDNRNNSRDSRSTEVGLIKRDNIIGKATYRIWPLDAIGQINQHGVE